MGVNKNFVVKNGLEVADGLLFTDADNNVVGVGSTVPDSNYIFHVTGGIGATTLNVSSQTTSNTITATTSVTVGTAVTVNPGGLNAPTGVVTASSFVGTLTGDVTGTASTAQSLTGSPSIIVGISTISGFVFNSGIVTSSTAGVATYYGKFIGDVSEATGLTAAPGGNDTEIQYNNLDSTTQGAAYFVYNKTTNSVGIGTSVATNTLTVTGSGTSTTNLRVTGVSTFVGTVTANGLVDIDGHTELDDVNVSGIITAASASVTNLSGTIGTVTTLGSTNGTITNLSGTIGTVTTLGSTNGTITNLNFTNLSGTIGTVTTLNSTNETITNLSGTIGTVTTLNSTNGTVTNIEGTSLNYTGFGTVGVVTVTTSLTVGAGATINGSGLVVSGLSTFTSGSGSVTAGSGTTSVLIVEGNSKVSGSVSFSLNPDIFGIPDANHLQFEADHIYGTDRTLAYIGFSTQYNRHQIEWTPGYSGSAAYGIKFTLKHPTLAFLDETWASIYRTSTTLTPLTISYDSYGSGNALTVNNSSGNDALVVTSTGDVNINPDADPNIDVSIYGKYSSLNASVRVDADTISQLIQVGVSTNNEITINDGNIVLKGDGTADSGELRAYTHYSDSDYQSPVAHVLQSNVSGPTLVIENSRNDNAYDGLRIAFSDYAADDNTATFIECIDSSATRMIVYSDGDVWTADAGTLSSDETLKENIVDATPKLDDVMKLKVRNYNWIEEFSPNQHDKKMIGFIAQEFEEVFPGLVSEHDISPDKENPNFKKGIKEAKLIPILTKALQEAVERIENLETELAALKSALGE